MRETELKNKIMRYLKRAYPGIWAYKTCDKFTSGIPDIIGCMNGKLFALELKSKEGRATKLQEYTIRRIRRAGGLASVCYSLEDVKDLLGGGV